ncbi:MAG TPA: insulinase family protein [Candidatus Acidoferrales bacterium]|nr:insulinase family protein [Candidatus Acidoferrales bacterium]
MTSRPRSARLRAAVLLVALAFGCRPALAAAPSTPSPALPAPNPSPAVTASLAPASSPPIATRVLSNGLRVVVVEDHPASVVQTAMWYRFGANEETPGKTGLAHGLEHMMFRGTPSISSAGLDLISARLGAELDANTDNDYTHFYFVLPADRLDLALRIEADRMQHLSLREADWKLEKGAVLSEYDSDLSQPVTKLYDAVCRAATHARLCGLSALGERADIVRSTAADLRHYYREYYAPNNATLVITGDVKADDAFALAAREFGSIPARPLPQRSPLKATYTSGKSVTVTANFPYAVVDLAYPAPGAEDPGNGALQIVDSVINNQRSAFYTALVVSGITLGYQTSYDTNVHDGLYHVFFVLAPGHTGAQARVAFERTLAKTEADGFPADLVDAAKVAVAANAIYARESVSGLGDRVGYALGVEGISDPALDDERVQTATLDDVDNAAKTFLATPSVVGILTPLVAKPGQAAAPPSGVSDNFSNRAPNGPIVLAPWARAAINRPITIESKIDPVRFTLANGIRVLVQEVHANPTVFVSGSIESSPRFDPVGKEGTGDLATTLLSYGSQKYDFTAQRRITDELAASIDLGDSFGAHGMAKDLGTLLDLLADGEEHPAFPPAYVELLRQQTLAGIAQRDQDPDYLASRAFQRLLLPPSDPELRESSIASVKAITTDDLRAYVHAYLRPDLTTISVVGDVDPDDVRAKLEAAFGTWTADGPKPDTSELPIPPPKPTTAFVTTARDEVSVRLGQPVPSRRSPDFYALNVMNEILGGGGTFDTRLMKEIRVKRGLVYSVSSSLDVDRYRGSLQFELEASPKNVAPAVAVLKSELVRMRNTPVTADELATAKTKIVAGALVSEEATDAIVARVDNIGGADLPSDYYKTLAQRYNTITIADVQRVARKYLLPGHLVEVFEGPRL